MKWIIEYRKELIKGLGYFILMCIVICLIAFATYYAGSFFSGFNKKENPGVTTVSTGQIYDDTIDNNQKVYIYPTDDSYDSPIEDNILVKSNEKYPGFKFDCKGLSANRTLYIMIDGDIDNVAGVYRIKEESHSGTVLLKRDFLGVGEHTVQFVQFDGPTVIFCKTRHYKVEK